MAYRGATLISTMLVGRSSLPATVPHALLVSHRSVVTATLERKDSTLQLTLSMFQPPAG